MRRHRREDDAESATATLDNDDELTAASSSTGGLNNSYAYDANGQQTGRTLAGTAYTLAFDYDGQLTSLTQGSTVTSYTYDATGRRVSRAAGGTTTDFYYGGGHILAEKQSGTTSAVYAYGNSLIRKDGEYPLFDGLGSERTVTNSSQTVTGTITFDGFGNTIGGTGISTDPYMYGAGSGYRTEGDAGLSQVGARYYDAQTGRFITRDTDLTQKPYLYCEHDPVNNVDPSGHDPFDGWWPWIKGVGIGFVGTITLINVGEHIDEWWIEYQTNDNMRKMIDNQFNNEGDMTKKINWQALWEIQRGEYNQATQMLKPVINDSFNQIYH